MRRWKVRRAPIAALLSLLVAVSARAEPPPAASDPLAEARERASAEGASAADKLRYAGRLRAVFRFDDARSVLEQLAASHPDDPAVWTELARVDAMAGLAGPASSHARRAVKLGATGYAPQLVERLRARGRIGVGRALPQPEGSPASKLAALLAALERGELERANGQIRAPKLEGAPAGAGARLGAYASTLKRVTGVSWLGYEVSAGVEERTVRLRLLWKVVPAELDLEATLALPPVYRRLLPLDWLHGLEEFPESLRQEALARARRATWTQVTLADVILDDGVVTAVKVDGDDVLDVPLPLDTPASKSEGAITTAAGGSAGDGSASEKPSTDEMFRNRYGKSEPAKGEPYMWRQILFGLAIVFVVGLLLWWLVRRETRRPPTRSREPRPPS